MLAEEAIRLLKLLYELLPSDARAYNSPSPLCVLCEIERLDSRLWRLKNESFFPRSHAGLANGRRTISKSSAICWGSGLSSGCSGISQDREDRVSTYSFW